MVLKLTRRGALLLGGSALIAGAARADNPEAQGFAPDITDRLDLGYRSGLLAGLHAVLVIRNGETVLERYFVGADENWGRPLGEVTFGPSTLHDLRSVSKSITSLLYGIALDQGLVPAPEASLLDAFPQYPDLAADPQRQAWTVGHALNMTLGTEWNENLPYTNPANSEIAMERADDRYRFILDRPIVSEPGSQWNYNGGCSALIGHLIAQGADMSLTDYAEEQLFAPLGIEQFEWSGGRDGVPSAASGLRLTAPDLARIGEMILANGTLNGRQIVSEAWLQRCRTPQTQARFGMQYSHQWYLSEQPVPAAQGTRPMIFAQGNGGQRLFVLPSLGLSVVTYSGNYNRFDQWINPTLVLQKIVLANILEL